ncbi:putative O-glycosylation ligase, exosortase A system-associated [Massilia sp. DD77]|uniref:putative O-glycosylation ligase, exosortase A system-associated n=1 Tax=Massilia sp. DD77 TaxID=3109349 RepID=UPI00300071A2
MRDLFLLALLPVLLYAMAKRPFVAVGMWLWTSLFYPNAWVYGMASGVRYNLLFAGLAILGYLAWKPKPKVHFGVLGGLVITFFVWTTISSIFTVGLPVVVWDIWGRLAKIVLLFVFVLLVLEKKLHVDFMLWCVVLSVGFYANVEGLKFIASGGHHKIAGMWGHVLSDRNELAISFVMTLPICYYLLHEYGSRWRLARLGLLGTIALLVIAVIGTQSRGGFIALTVLGGYMFVKSERKIVMGLMIAVLVIAVTQLASNEWVARINTIEAADEDKSFMGRVVAWKMSFMMAVNHPIFGGGFKSMEYVPNWIALANNFSSYSWFYTGEALPNPTHPRAAHSLYFQVLGEHGFVGLGLYISMLVVGFFKASRIGKRARALGAAPWLPLLATMLQLSIFAFALGAAALSFAYFDLIFALFGLVLVVEQRLLPQAVSRIGSHEPAVPASSRAATSFV